MIRKAVTTTKNHNYTITCTDWAGNSISFRDITGEDLEFLDSIYSKDGEIKKVQVSTDQVFDILSRLCVKEDANFRLLVPRSVEKLYTEVIVNLLCNYITKESWLKQCYSIQNGSFQNVSEMEKVPMSKFAAMCMIHKQAMDSISPQNNTPTPNGEPA